MLRQLASMITKKADPRSHNKPQGMWQLEPLEEGAGPDEIKAQIAKLQPLADKLEYGPGEAREITKQIKYADTHMTIISELNSLADKLGIPESELDYYERQVFEAKNKLESACYEMEELFQDKYKEVSYKIEELEMDLEDIEYNAKNKEI